MNTADRSSSNDLSSAPNSDTDGPTSIHPLSNTIVVARDGRPDQSTPNASALRSNAGQVASATADRQDIVPKQRKPRKKKESDAASTPAEKKEKGTRRPRGGSTAAGSTRKKLKTESSVATPTLQTIPIVSEPAYPRPIQSNTIDLTARAIPTSSEAAKFSQNGFLNNSSAVSPQKSVLSPYNAAPAPPPPPPSQPPVARSLAYDPVRSLTMPRNNDPPPVTSNFQSSLTTPPRMPYNPSTSPTISSIMNPPDASTVEPRIPQPAYHQPQQPHQPQQADRKSLLDLTITKPPEDNTAMDIDPPSVKSESSKRPTPEAVPTKPTTKPRAKEQPPPLPTGSGLLSSTLFGGDSGMDSGKTSDEKGTSIVLHIDLKGPGNKVINFARLAEEKYGFAALYPRQAAQKERLAKVAAAGAALERAGAGIKGTPAGESGDEDVSVDIDRDSENDGDIAMSGMNGTGEAVNSGTDGPVPKRRKRKDEYDADDPFVDDSELLWEAQAAASKDGFFVYCGPLVPDGEKPTVERADGTVKRGRGRGRGGGPGSRGGRGAAAAAARDAEGGGNTNGGPGSRGGGITRKPRITKAERAQRELEKKQREQMAVLAAKPPNYQP